MLIPMNPLRSASPRLLFCGFVWLAGVAALGVGPVLAELTIQSVGEQARPTTWAWREVVQTQNMPPPMIAAPKKSSDELSPLLLHAEPDTDVVQMAPYRVQGNRVEKELHWRFAEAAKHAKDQAIADRLGIRTYGFGYKHFGAGVVTVFYIPVMAGFGFSW